jgi:hypothetical protein
MMIINDQKSGVINVENGVLKIDWKLALKMIKNDPL